MLDRPSNLPVLAFALIALASGGALSQEAAKQPGCTTVNGVSTGADCQEGAGDPSATTTEGGMPATKHQEEVLGGDKNASQGQNMEATGAGGGQLPATQHQQDVMEKPAVGEQKQPGQ